MYFKFYAQWNCSMKIQNNVFGKSQDYNATIPPQEKHQRAESYHVRMSLHKETTIL